MEEKPADVKRLKALQSDLHDIFIDWVKDRRGDRLTGEDKVLFEGAFWAADTALNLGLIDGLGSMKAVCRETFGEGIKFANFTPEKGMVSSFIGGEAKINLPRDLAEVIEDKAIWGRFGF